MDEEWTEAIKDRLSRQASRESSVKKTKKAVWNFTKKLASGKKNDGRAGTSPAALMMVYNME